MFNKFKGRYAQRKKTERDVMSYEDMPLDDYEQEKTEISPEAVKKIIIGVCIALAAGLIVFAFANKDKLTWDNISNWWTYDVLGNAGNGYPVNIVGSEVSSGNFSVNQGHVAYASDTSFVTLNSTGSEISNIQLRYSNPAMKSSSNRYLTYGIGGTGYQIQSIDSMLYSGEAEGVIYTGDISSNGVYCLVTEGNGYFSTLYVYNSNNNRIFKYSFSEYYINTIALNSNGTGCIACGVTTENGAVKTGVYILDFSHEEPKAKYEIKDDMAIDCKYLNDNRMVVVGETASYIIKNGDEQYVTQSYEGKTLVNYCFSPDTNTYALALSRNGDGRSCVLERYNDNGEKTCTINTETGADSLSIYKGTIAVLDGNKAYGYDNSGNQTFACDTGTGSKSIILTSDSHAYVLSVNQVRYFDLKNPPATSDTAG
ncbi:MAG: DUF5711 family protein [Ruminococcus sp.]|nr:DUF5711 family protein [Ruminococcus sp.]